MKLLNKSLIYLSVLLFIIIGLWSVIFYFNVLAEIKESVDEGLDNYKRQIVYQAQRDSTVLTHNTFDVGFFAIRELSQAEALQVKDSYIDTMMYMQDADDESPELEPARMLTTAFENNGRYYELKIINSMVEEDDLVGELLLDALGLYLFLIAVVILINNFVLQRLWQPFYSFLNQLKNYRIGSNARFPEVTTRTKEFIDLQKAVTILLQQNIETYEQQKQFIGNASHELQTPLAIVTNKLELLIEKGNLSSDQAEGIAEIMSIIDRLVRLNKSLLLLTKIENKQFLDNRIISLNELVKQSVNDLEEIAEFMEIGIHVSEQADVAIEMDRSLATIIVSNLLRNALFHNVSGGSVKVDIVKNGIIVSNTGITTPLDAEKIFTRFYKSESDQNGSGLGLTIVKAICDLYGFSISYRFENSLHTFEISFN
jgi:two-component system sensor histidine kinase QseC